MLFRLCRWSRNRLRGLRRAWGALRAIDPGWLWGINLFAVAAVVVWLFYDPRFEASIEWWKFETALDIDSESIRDMGDWRTLAFRNRMVATLLTVASSSMGLLLLGLGFGRRRSRSIMAWLMLTTVLALWIGVAVSWQDIAWIGKQHRLRRLLNEFNAIVVDFQNDWPTRDGSRGVVGPFMAYPVYDPKTLILLTLPEFEHTTTSIAAIEGSEEGPIRFDLVGLERGDWVEWHPVGSQPTTFVSGIGEPYTLERSHRLADGWFLVRYKD